MCHYVNLVVNECSISQTKTGVSRFYFIFYLGPSLFIRKEGELTDVTTYCAVAR